MLPEVLPTIDEMQSALDSLDAALALLPTEKRQVWPYYGPLLKAAAESAEQAGEPGLAAANDLLNLLCFGALGIDAPAKPWGEEMEMIRRNIREGRAPGEGLLPFAEAVPVWVPPIARLRNDHYNLLASVLSGIQDDDLRARVGDALWSARRDIAAGREAINAYLASAQLLNTTDWTHAVERLIRAVSMEKAMGIRNGLALGEVEGELSRHQNGDATYYSAFLMEALLALGWGSASHIAPLAEVAARCAENESHPDWDKAERYWKLSSQWWSKVRNDAGREQSLMSLAEVYHRRAEAILVRANQIMPHSHAAHWIEQAIHTLRGVSTPAARNRAQELHRQLVAIQSHIPGSGFLITHSVDAPEIPAEVQRRISGNELLDALAMLAFLHTPSHPKTICRESSRMAKQTPLLSMLPQVATGTTGGTMAREIPATNTNKSRQRERRRVRMIQHAHHGQNFIAQAVVLSGVRVINDEHRVSVPDLLPFLEVCAFVLPGHERLFARGLLAGVHGDWFLAAQILVPQIEAGFRSLLLSLGATTPVVVQRGEREWGMQEFLYDADCWKRLATIFGESLLYDARVLLTEKFGGNLRPLFAHGLLPQSTPHSPFVFHLVYLWWLALRLCFAVIRVQAAGVPQQSDKPR